MNHKIAYQRQAVEDGKINYGFPPGTYGGIIGDGVRLYPCVDHFQQEVKGLPPFAAFFAGRDRRAVAHHVRLFSVNNEAFLQIGIPYPPKPRVDAAI